MCAPLNGQKGQLQAVQAEAYDAFHQLIHGSRTQGPGTHSNSVCHGMMIAMRATGASTKKPRQRVLPAAAV